jgi:hypothetical protein
MHNRALEHATVSTRKPTQRQISRRSILSQAPRLLMIAAALAVSMPSEARLAGNRLASNRLASNRLASNRLASNRLAGNTLAANRLAGDGAFTGIAAIDLPNGMRFTR